MNGISVLADRLVCPRCAGSIRLDADAATCTACGAVYRIAHGILAMAEPSADGAASDEAVSTKTREAYEGRYRELAHASRYHAAYQGKLSKRWSTAREFRLLERLLRSQPRSSLLLDLPCGGGRLSPALAAHADQLIEADVALGQVMHARENALPGANQVWMTASALNIPLRDNSVDGVVCCRLSHHLPKADERARLVHELLRVSRRFVILTYFDHRSIKNVIRRLRQPLNGKLPKMTMTRRGLAELAAGRQARLTAAPWLAFFSSGHRYALMVKNPV